MQHFSMAEKCREGTKGRNKAGGCFLGMLIFKSCSLLLSLCICQILDSNFNVRTVLSTGITSHRGCCGLLHTKEPLLPKEVELNRTHDWVSCHYVSFALTTPQIVTGQSGYTCKLWSKTFTSTTASSIRLTEKIHTTRPLLTQGIDYCKYFCLNIMFHPTELINTLPKCPAIIIAV